MTFPLAALILLTDGRPVLQTPQILTQNGSKLERMELNPGSVRARCWHYRLYQPNSPAFGESFWGVVEEPSYDRLKQTLVRQRRQQVGWWTWASRQGRPEPMPFTMFNALGPIAVMDDEAWSETWGKLGPGAAREVAARKRRLALAQEVEDELYNLLAEATWNSTFDQYLFANQGVAIYQAAPVANAVITLRGLEADLRSNAPISIAAANVDLATLGAIGQRLIDVADQLGKIKPPPGLVSPTISTPDALSLLNGRFSNYTVQAGEGGASSETGTMSFSFTEGGFSLEKSPPGWYGGNEPVAFASLDPTSVRYDPLFGGPQRGGIVFLPKDELRSSYRGPNGLILPLGTTPREAESLAQAFRRLVRIANGVAVAEPPKDEDQAGPDPQTAALVARLRNLGRKLVIYGGSPIGDAEIVARAPAALSAAIAKRNQLWRDSELSAAIQKQGSPGTSYGNSVGDTMTKLGIPMAFTPTEPPTWHIVRVNRSGAETKIVVREACRAKRGKKDPLFTIFRLTEEKWTSADTKPRLQSMRVLVSSETPVPARTTTDALSNEFFRMGDATMRQNRLPEAERLYRRAIAMRPGWASAWNSLGVAVVRQGRVDDAAPFCAQSVQLNPKFVLGLTNLADIRRVQGQLNESKDLAQRAVTLAPKDPWARTVLGHACFANGDFADAERHYQEALQIEPGNGATHADLAGALLRQNKRQEATAEASRAIELGWRTHWVYKELAIPNP